MEPVAVADLSQAVAEGIIAIRDERLEFERPIHRSIIIAAAPLDRVQRTHAALAEVVRDEDRRAMHRAYGVVEPDAQLADDVESAGATAYRHGHPTRAARAFVRAAQLSESDDDRARRLILAAALAFELGLPAYARRLLNLVDELRRLRTRAHPRRLAAVPGRRHPVVAGAHGSVVHRHVRRSWNRRASASSRCGRWFPSR